jgi:hypothetical protein
MSYKRNGNKWTVNEILALQREYELLKLSVQEMSIRHKRSEIAIMYKLDSEGFINSWSEVKGFDLDRYQKGIRGDLIVSDDDEDCDDVNDEDYVENEGGGDDDCDYEDDEDKDDYEQQVSTLSDRVWSLETSVSQIGSTVSKIFDMLTLFKLDRLNQLKKNSESLNME